MMFLIIMLVLIVVSVVVLYSKIIKPFLENDQNETEKEQPIYIINPTFTIERENNDELVEKIINRFSEIQSNESKEDHKEPINITQNEPKEEFINKPSNESN